MSRLYKRKIRVVIGQEDSTAIAIESLYMQFEIKKGISGKPNEGFVKIFNLAESTETQIQEKGVRIRVFAGYDGKASLLHDGDIRKIEHSLVPSERITSISLGGNTLKLSQAIFNKAYSGQVSVKQIVADAIPSFNITATNLNQIPADAFLNDFSYTGKTSILLDKVLNPIGVQWFENDNFISFSKGTAALEDVVLLNKNTGLIGSPAITDKGIQFKSLLNGQIGLNNRVSIESNAVTGVFKVTELTHRGDNRDGEFVSEGLGVEIEQS